LNILFLINCKKEEVMRIRVNTEAYERCMDSVGVVDAAAFFVTALAVMRDYPRLGVGVVVPVGR